MKNRNRIFAAAALILGAMLILFVADRDPKPLPTAETSAAPPRPKTESIVEHEAFETRAKRIVPAVVAPDAQGMSFSGRVISRTTDAPIAGAELLFERSSGAHSIKSDTDGSFRFEPVEPGAYRLAAITAIGHLPFAPA